MGTCRTNISQLRGQRAKQWLPEIFFNNRPIHSLYATDMPSFPSLEESGEEPVHFGSGRFHDRRQEPSVHDRSSSPDGLDGEQRYAQIPPQQRSPAAKSPVVSLGTVRDTTTEEDNILKTQEVDSASSIIKRSVNIGMETEKLEERDRSDMMRWFNFVISTDDLDKIKKALELALTIQNLPLKLRQEPRQACIGLLHTMVPRHSGEQPVATAVNASEVSLKLHKDILELKVAMDRVCPNECSTWASV